MDNFNGGLHIFVTGPKHEPIKFNLFGLSARLTRLDSNIKSKSLNNTYLNIIKIFNKLFKKINIIKSRNLVVT